VQADEKTDRKDYVFHSFGAQFAKVLVDPVWGLFVFKKLPALWILVRLMNLKTATKPDNGLAFCSAMGMALMEETKYEP